DLHSLPTRRSSDLLAHTLPSSLHHYISFWNFPLISACTQCVCCLPPPLLSSPLSHTRTPQSHIHPSVTPTPLSHTHLHLLTHTPLSHTHPSVTHTCSHTHPSVTHTCSHTHTHTHTHTQRYESPISTHTHT